MPKKKPAAPNKEKGNGNYQADSIQVLKGLEAVRRRPAMYIGSVSARGLHHLVYEVVDNSVDEALAGYCTEISVTIHADNAITVADNGRGIPVDLHKTEKKPGVEVALTVLHAGGKFNKASYKVSGGLHGVGVSVVNALSELLKLEIRRQGKVFYQEYRRGDPATEFKEIGVSDRTGTSVTFKADAQIFRNIDFSYDTLAQRMRELSYLNRGLSITIIDERPAEPRRLDFSSAGGLVSFVEDLNASKETIHNQPIELKGAGIHPDMPG